MTLNKFKANNSSATKASLIKFDVPYIVIVTQIKFKFHEIPFSGHLVMALDGRTERRADGRTNRQTWTKLYPFAFGRG